MNGILKDRKLLPSYTVVAPEHVHDEEDCPDEHTFHVQKMLVKPGDNVQAGQALCLLADHCELFLEGRAFEGDAARLRAAVQHGWEITAVALSGDGGQAQSDDQPNTDERRSAERVAPGGTRPPGRRAAPPEAAVSGRPDRS